MARLIDSVIGHRDVWTKLLRQSERGRLPHALGFVGQPGIGKKRVGWALAQALVCEAADARPCGECPPCRRVANQQSESVHFVQPQNGLIKIEAAHQILEFLNLRRLGRSRVVLIDSAQAMNPQTANALLKAVEEPPEQTYFILLISELAQVLPTLRSRLQVIKFAPLSEAELGAGEGAPDWMLRSARGSFEFLENLRAEESVQIRSLLMGFLSDALRGRREGLDALLDETKDRDSALRAAKYLQQLLRDWTVVETGEVLNSDLKSELQSLRDVDSARRVSLWRRAFQMEQDLVAHSDRTLAFENFYLQAKHL